MTPPQFVAIAAALAAIALVTALLARRQAWRGKTALNLALLPLAGLALARVFC